MVDRPACKPSQDWSRLSANPGARYISGSGCIHLYLSGNGGTRSERLSNVSGQDVCVDSFLCSYQLCGWACEAEGLLCDSDDSVEVLWSLRVAFHGGNVILARGVLMFLQVHVVLDVLLTFQLVCHLCPWKVIARKFDV